MGEFSERTKQSLRDSAARAREARTHWTCPHGFVTGFFPVPGEPNLIEYRSCGICCEEILATEKN
jgi:hypothetical protein